MNKILVVGQTPPPYGGQAMMIQRLVNAKFNSFEIVHLRLAFSKNFTEIGGFSFLKLLHLIVILIKAFKIKLKYKIKVLYYPPSGPNLNPILRDILLLIVLRRLFPKCIFHFRAAGISEYLETSNKLLKKLALLAFNKPDCSIQLSDKNPSDGKYFSSKIIEIIPNGIEDIAKDFLPIIRNNTKINILHIGVLHENKGIFYIIEALKLLLDKDIINFHLYLVGEFPSTIFKSKIIEYCKKNKMEEFVEILGPKIGKPKWDLFCNSDIFCFPTFFESESFGNVLLEAMMFELPVVATNWRAIPEIIDDNVNGFLVPIKDSVALSKKLEVLINNSELRIKMGKMGRKKFLENYTLDKHLNKMEVVLSNILNV